MDRSTISFWLAVLALAVIMVLLYENWYYKMPAMQLSECGYSIRPIFGKELADRDQDKDFDQVLEFEQGRFKLSHLNDNEPPQLYRYDFRGNLQWAVEFRKTHHDDFERLSKLTLVESQKGYRLSGYNLKQSDYLYIQPDKQYNVSYMCLRPYGDAY